MGNRSDQHGWWESPTRPTGTTTTAGGCGPHDRPERSSRPTRVAIMGDRNGHHGRPERSSWPTGTVIMADRNGHHGRPERSSWPTGTVIMADRNGHHGRPERSSWPTGTVIMADRNGHHGRPERSSWATGVVIMGDGSGHRAGVGAAGRRGRARVAWPRRSWVRRARGERLLPLGSSRYCWDIGGAPVAAGGGYGEAETSTRDGHPWGQVLTDGGIAAVIPLLVATRETCSPVKRPACYPSLVRPPGCGSGARRWDGLVAVSARRYATPAAGWPEGCFRPGFSDSEDRCQ